MVLWRWAEWKSKRYRASGSLVAHRNRAKHFSWIVLISLTEFLSLLIMNRVTARQHMQMWLDVIMVVMLVMVIVAVIVVIVIFFRIRRLISKLHIFWSSDIWVPWSVKEDNISMMTLTTQNFGPTWSLIMWDQNWSGGWVLGFSAPFWVDILLLTKMLWFNITATKRIEFDSCFYKKMWFFPWCDYTVYINQVLYMNTESSIQSILIGTSIIIFTITIVNMDYVGWTMIWHKMWPLIEAPNTKASAGNLEQNMKYKIHCWNVPSVNTT